jgi:nickel transport protein
MSRRRAAAAASGLLLAAALLPPAWAHAARVELEPAPPAVLVLARYGEGAPAADARVTVLSPEEGGRTHQTGRTDRRGRFAFLPDRPGTWQVVVDDGLGHRAVARLAVAEGFGESAALSTPSSGGLPLALRWALGVALIAGLTLGLWALGGRGGTAS